MEDHIASDSSENRSLFWPLLFALIGTLNIVDFFYKSSFSTDDLLQGLGFLLQAPLVYFSPPSFANPFKPNPRKPPVSSLVKGSAFVGLALLIVGLIVEWL
ncbi:hypothetical protein [Luteimonas sp. A649]